jgi:hypothetical protein
MSNRRARPYQRAARRDLHSTLHSSKLLRNKKIPAPPKAGDLPIIPPNHDQTARATLLYAREGEPQAERRPGLQRLPTLVTVARQHRTLTGLLLEHTHPGVMGTQANGVRNHHDKEPLNQDNYNDFPDPVKTSAFSAQFFLHIRVSSRHARCSAARASRRDPPHRAAQVCTRKSGLRVPGAAAIKPGSASGALQFPIATRLSCSAPARYGERAPRYAPRMRPRPAAADRSSSGAQYERLSGRKQGSV